MAQIITNQASVAYRYNSRTASALSNIATAVLTEPLGVEKVSLEDTYRAGSQLTYSVTVTNGSSSALSGVTVTDDLGGYVLGSTTVVPLDYVGPAILLVDGSYVGSLTPTLSTDGVTFALPTLGVGASAQVIYKAEVNGSAPLAEGSTVTNTVTVTATGSNAPVTDSDTVTVDSYADVTITKSMTPSGVVDGETLTYTFVLSNFGNAAATDIVLSDTFDPAPEGITVQVDGTTLAASDYDYTGGVLTLPSESGTTALALDAATITQDPETGAVAVTPDTLTVTVTGVI